MRQNRSASQILFGYLPEQTVDLEGGVWRVRWWQYPNQLAVDDTSLRDALLSAARPWEVSNRDKNYSEMLRSGYDVKVLAVDKKNGVRVAPFPEQWRCKRCHRAVTSNEHACKCGARAWGQLSFVSYCGGCGSLEAPYLPTCNTHHQVKIEFPASASAREIRFVCPVCNITLRTGFGFGKCRTCGEQVSHNVHRASSVYTARSFVMVNAPSPERVQRLRAAGGGKRALRWLIQGMESATPSESTGSLDEVRRSLEAQNLPAAAIEAAMAAMKDQAGVSVDAPVPVSAEAEQQAMSVALALDEERLTLDQYRESLEDDGPLKHLHDVVYPAAMERAGVERLDLTTRFPLLTGSFGYSRGDPTPGATTLVPFRDRDGDFVVYGDLQATEAWFVRLDPVRVLKWLRGRGHDLESTTDPARGRTIIIEAADSPPIWADAPDVPTVGSDVLTLTHSYAHRMIRTVTSLAGIDRDALSEYLVPMHLGFFVYAAARGDFVLGGLEAVFEQDLHHVFSRIAYGEDRCALDPGCARHGAACVACMHLGEPSCRGFNRFLSRRALSTYLNT